MAHKKDLSNQKFGRLLAIISLIKNKKGSYIWHCKCDCGNICNVAGYRLKNGHTKSCGCLSSELLIKRNKVRIPKNKKPIGESAFNKLYRIYQRTSENKNMLFDISKEEAKNLFLDNCFYCGALPKQTIRTRKDLSPFIYNGIDRLNNDLGYLRSNVVTCCKRCNIAKNNMKLEDFLDLISNIYNNRVIKC